MQDEIAIVGWEEGSAGLIDSWAASAGLLVKYFVHPDDERPSVTWEDAMRGRAASQFDVPENGSFKGRPLICAKDWPRELQRRGVAKALVAVSDNAQRAVEIERAIAAGLTLVSAIHPTTTVLGDALLAQNVILHARSFVGYRAEIGIGAILNTGCQIDHHSVLRACCSLDPGVVLAGNVTVGSLARLHTGTVVKNKISIGANATIGAGTVVIRDVPEATTVIGVPARPLERRSSEPAC